MYQTPPQHEGVYTLPVQQPQVSNPQSQGHTGQAIMYQMPPDHSQPGFAGQPPMGQQAQYYVPAGQPVQPVQGQGAPVQPPNEDVSCIRIDSAYLKTSLSGLRVMEFVSLLIAWSCSVAYSNRTLGLDGRANFFKGVTIFCWVMVIVLQVMFMFGINKDKRYFGRPSNCTLISLGVQVLMTILLIACSISLTIRAIDLHKAHFDSHGRLKELTTNLILLLFGALPFSGLACLSFLDDIRLLSKLYREHRAKEIAAAGVVQQPGLQQ